ncbi:response regulator transcription factor [Clostridium sp. DJ247]|uniref:response regulator transcription factor n=1 Tax=Clostridium sp. DJ247 TaxID=2726188 RepID=UPI00162A7903|nr:response regulator transcription factor [Clostridium sp. DJ247]MBC2580067.1 response regulator transcription factor [Clostridium sp. DJ247]
MKRTRPYGIFLVEDDEMLREEIIELLIKWGFEVRGAEEFDDILNKFTQLQSHVVLMDVNIPSFDGFYWCKRIREISSVPIIYISSRDSNMDIIMGMNNGGDDYIIKPFDNMVLVAKLQAIIRRTYEYAQKHNIIECNGVILNLDDTFITYKDRNTELTKNEFKILKLLIENRGKVVSRQALMRSLWDEEVYVNENTLTVNVNRVRIKLEELGLKGFIATKKGMGYIVL